MNSPASTTDMLKKGIAAVKAGRRQQARELLMQVVERDEENIPAWLWLSAAMDSFEERETCLENVLALDPDNEMARKRLNKLRKKQQATPAPAPQAKKGTEQKKTAPEKEPTSIQALLENELLCPYCAAPTRSTDKWCQNCRKELWIKTPKRKKSSTLYKVLLGQQIFILLQYVVLALAIMLAPLEEIETTSALLDKAILLAVLTPTAIYNLAMLVGLYLRWRPIFYLYLFGSIVGLGIGLALAIGLGGRGICCGGPLVLLSVSQFFMMLNLGDDFTFNKHRLLLRIDPDIKTGLNFLERGKSYADRQMWAMAAIHLHRASSQLPTNINAHLALAVALVNLKLPKLAAHPLEKARQINPTDPGVERLAELLAKQGKK